MIDQPLALTAPGLLTPAGGTIEEVFAATRGDSGPFGIEKFTFEDHQLEAWTGRVEFDPGDHFERARLRRLDRLHQLGLIAARRTRQGFGGDLAGEDVGLIVGTVKAASTYLAEQHHIALSRPHRVNPLAIAITMQSSLAGHVAAEFNMAGPSMTLNAECATGLALVNAAVDWIRNGRARRVLVGGCDASVNFSVVAMFTRMGALADIERSSTSVPFSADRHGFVLAEGAAFAVVEPLEDVIARDEQPLAVLSGTALRTDISHLIAPDPTGEAHRRAIRAAIDDAGCDAREIASVNAHATATPANDTVEANAIHEIVGSTVPITGNKSVTGHMFAASGLAELLVAARTAQTGTVPRVAGLVEPDGAIGGAIATDEVDVGPGLVLATSFGFGGHYAAAVLAPPPE